MSVMSQLFRVYSEGVFTTEAQSSQSSEYFLIKNSLLRALRASAVQSTSPRAEIELPGLTIRKPEDPTPQRWLYSSFIVAASALLLASCASVKTFVVLLPEETGVPSAVTVGEGNRQVILEVPLSAAAVDGRGNVERSTVTKEEIDRTFADALAAQPPKSISFTLYFDTKSTEVSAASRPALAELLAEVAKRAAVEVQVTGHTDRVGTDTDNDRLSLERAEAMRAMLIQRGIKASFIRAVGRGEREPLIATPDEQSEPRNRRVEVIVR